MPPHGPVSEELLRDLADEQSALDAIIGSAVGSPWDIPTPAEGWAVRDQVSHLAYFDEVATMAVRDPDRFRVLADAARAQQADPMEEHLARGRAMDGDALMAWWRAARGEMIQELGSLDAAARVEWFGPPMGVASFVTARLMETWAHGQDVADALGVERAATPRLRHIAHLGVRTRSFAYMVRGLDPPDRAVVVELSGPGGETWSFLAGPDEPAPAGRPAQERVSGSALDFCLVVTQRRNLADTSLVISGSRAREWMEIAQAFAGPPGPGRPPGKAAPG